MSFSWRISARASIQLEVTTSRSRGEKACFAFTPIRSIPERFRGRSDSSFRFESLAGASRPLQPKSEIVSALEETVS